jgi:cupin superfamily acireductone dioxygenase involved in methionine salvage
MKPTEILLASYRALTASLDLLVASQKGIIEQHVKKIERLELETDYLWEENASLNLKCEMLEKLLEEKS